MWTLKSGIQKNIIPKLEILQIQKIKKNLSDQSLTSSGEVVGDFFQFFQAMY
jgi:hypothetical protein